MKQVLMEFLRCAGILKSGKRCHYKARYSPDSASKFCGHHQGRGLKVKPGIRPLGMGVLR